MSFHDFSFFYKIYFIGMDLWKHFVIFVDFMSKLHIFMFV